MTDLPEWWEVVRKYKENKKNPPAPKPRKKSEPFPRDYHGRRMEAADIRYASILAPSRCERRYWDQMLTDWDEETKEYLPPITGIMMEIVWHYKGYD